VPDNNQGTIKALVLNSFFDEFRELKKKFGKFFVCSKTTPVLFATNLVEETNLIVSNVKSPTAVAQDLPNSHLHVFIFRI